MLNMTCLMTIEVLTSCLHNLAGRHPARHAPGRQQAACESQTGHRHRKLTRQLSQLSLASELTQLSSSISSWASAQPCSSDNALNSDTGYCSSSALFPTSFAVLASAQRQPRLSSSSSSLEPASPPPGPHPTRYTGGRPTQQQSPGKGQQDCDAGTKLIALKQKRHAKEGHAHRAEVDRVGGNKQHAKHSAHSTAHRAQHADVSRHGTGIRRQYCARHRLDDAELQRSQDSRKQPGASGHHAVAAASDVHKRRQARQQHRVEQDFPSESERVFLRHGRCHAPANTIPAPESSSTSEQYIRRQQVSSRRSPGLINKHDEETAQRMKQSRKVHSCPRAANGQNQSRPAALLASAQPPWLEHDAAAESNQAMHLGSTVESHRQPHERSQKQQLRYVEALQDVGSGQHEAALLAGATTAAHMTSSQSLAPAKAVLTEQPQHCEGTANAECREAEAASGTAKHSAHHAATIDSALSPLPVDSNAVRAGLHGHALETALPGRVAVDAAGEPLSAQELHSAAVTPATQDVTLGPMQALLIALENMTNMGQQKLAALGQPNPAAPASAAAAEPPVAAPAAGETVAICIESPAWGYTLS